MHPLSDRTEPTHRSLISKSELDASTIAHSQSETFVSPVEGMALRHEQCLNHLGQRLQQQVTDWLAAKVHGQEEGIAGDRLGTVQVFIETLSQWITGENLLFLQQQEEGITSDRQAMVSLEKGNARRSDRFVITHLAPASNQQLSSFQISGKSYSLQKGEPVTERALATLRECLPDRSWLVSDEQGLVGWLFIFPPMLPIADGGFEIQAFQVMPLPTSTTELIERSIAQWRMVLNQIGLLRSLHRQHQELVNHNHELKQTNRLKSEFLANTSHEIRTPLSSILGFTHLLQAQGYSPTNLRHQEYLNIILSSGQHLLALINDILDLSKIEANQLDLQWEAIDVPDLCRMVLTLVREKANDKGLTLKLTIDPQVTTLVADALRLKQMLFNLLSNAIKFTVLGTVGVEVVKEETILRFTVWDTGTGISQEHQRLLFQPYTQLANSATVRGEGTGLGLALTQKLAELHGGWIEVKSELDLGSHFTICLPLIPAVSSEAKLASPMPHVEIDSPTPSPAASPARKPARKRYRSTAAESPNALPQKPPRSRKRMPSQGTVASVAQSSGLIEVHPETEKRPNHVLLVEDNIHNAKLMLTFLSKSGYEVTWVQDGREMWRTLEHFYPGLILMDIHLPEVDGLTLIRQLKTDDRYRSIPVIAQTALAMKGDRDLCLQAGAVDYISKPIDLDGLIELVSKHVGDRA